MVMTIRAMATATKRAMEMAVRAIKSGKGDSDGK
jgi:hypothetical protein